MKVFISCFQKFPGLSVKCVLAMCCCLLFLTSTAQIKKTKKRDTLYGGYPLSEHINKGDEAYTAEEKTKMREQKYKTFLLRKELMEKLRNCPKGKDGDDCRKEYRKQLDKLEEEEKQRLEEMILKYELDKKYGADLKIPDDKYKDYKPNYDRIALFLPKDYKELPAYKKDPAVRRTYDDIKQDEEKLIQLFKALDDCPPGKAGVVCKKDLQQQIKDVKTRISQKLDKALADRKLKKK